jgi:hypothetical protein
MALYGAQPGANRHRSFLISFSRDLARRSVSGTVDIAIAEMSR